MATHHYHIRLNHFPNLCGDPCRNPQLLDQKSSRSIDRFPSYLVVYHLLLLRDYAAVDQH